MRHSLSAGIGDAQGSPSRQGFRSFSHLKTPHPSTMQAPSESRLWPVKTSRKSATKSPVRTHIALAVDRVEAASSARACWQIVARFQSRGVLRVRISGQSGRAASQTLKAEATMRTREARIIFLIEICSLDRTCFLLNNDVEI